MALIVLLNQFSRNMFRGAARAFTTDALASGSTETAVDRGFDQALPAVRRRFVYIPLGHAEDVDHQSRYVALFDSL